jgi:valyl-tRNA synthetase
MIEKTYQPSAVEQRIYAKWEEAGAFRCGRPERRDAEPFCIVIPPPNVTGSLHMGHALNNTLQDVLARFERMRGRDVLWQPGTDHAGIATQMVVERQLMERQEPSRRALGREKFLEKVWAWKAESGGTITTQLKRLGASCDWSRERFTMDAGLSRAVLEVFVELYRAGLIYKDKRLVNWDPKLLTAISDLEVQQVEIKGHLWHFRYPVEGRDGSFITVATTRPETMLGDTAVAVHPDDGRYRELVGKNAILPLVGRRIPIVADEYSDPEKGTGAVKITPAHDFNDFEVGRRHQLPLVDVLDLEANLNLEGNEAFLRGVPRSPQLEETLAYHGLDRFLVRKQIVARMESAGLLAKTESHTHMVPHGDRSGVVIEPFLTEQWYVDAHTLAQPAIAAVRDGRTSPGASRASSGGDTRSRPGMDSRPTRRARCCSAAASSSAPWSRLSSARPSRRRLRRRANITAPATSWWSRTPTRQSRKSTPRNRASARPRSQSGATRTCSTPGSHRRCGRSRRSAGRNGRRSWGAITLPMCW